MIGKALSRNELKQVIGGDGCWPGGPPGDPFLCNACTSTCIYEPNGPGAGCPPGGNCILKECPSMASCCDLYEEQRYYARCDWEG